MLSASLLFGLSIGLTYQVLAQGVPPAWAGWPKCAFDCADGLGCQFPQDRCVCVHNTFLACVTFSLCDSDDADLTRNLWDSLCTFAPPPLSTESTSVFSSTRSTSTPPPPSPTIAPTVVSSSSPSSTPTPTSTTQSSRQSSVSNTSSQSTSASMSSELRSSTSGTTTQTTPGPTFIGPTTLSPSAGDGNLSSNIAVERKTNTGAIVGGVLGGLTGVAAILAFLVYRKRSQRGDISSTVTEDYSDEKAFPVVSHNELGSSVLLPSSHVSAYQSPPTVNAIVAPINSNPKSRVVQGSGPQTTPFSLKPASNNEARLGDVDISTNSSSASNPLEGAQQNVYIPRSSMEKGRDPFRNNSSHDVVEAILSPPVVQHPLHNPHAASPFVGTTAMDSEAFDGPSTPVVIFEVDSEVQPPPYINAP